MMTKYDLTGRESSVIIQQYAAHTLLYNGENT